MDGGAGRFPQARALRDAGEGHVDGAADLGRPMVRVPPAAGGLTRGPDPAGAGGRDLVAICRDGISGCR